MKKTLPFLCFILAFTAKAQITSPVIRSGFGVDADLKSNFFNGFVQSGNDDWYNNGNAGTGQFVIDTTGAAAIRNGYASDVSPYPKRMASFYRTMSKPQFSVVNNRLWLDALFVRDYHGTDTTAFVSGSNKNGMSPTMWSGGVQNIPDKNDILDMYMHVRRAGPNTTDSLWFFGGLSLDNVTGNRYFDFEMYQTDISYDRASSKWYGYGPDAGHTSWKFDASGNVLTPGDIIFSAEYQSASLTNIEARIWVSKTTWQTVIPSAFDWSGQFDGDGTGAAYGYASILPKAGGTFYTGLQCANNEWAGPFNAVMQDNTLATNYLAKQFMEFSVNLTKLGLDPVTVFGTDVCGTPFNRMVVKTRSSASFTSELKDFVAPTDLFLAPRVDALADVPIFCGAIGVSTLQVQNPSSASVYTWAASNGGHIVGATQGTSVNADAPGTYIVYQQLAAGCGTYATDTITITYDATCVPMEARLSYFKGKMLNEQAHLQWAIAAGSGIQSFEVQRSDDGRFFTGATTLAADAQSQANYSWADENSGSGFTYYRLKIKLSSGAILYSNVVQLYQSASTKVQLFPNPATDKVQVLLPGVPKGVVDVTVANAGGGATHQARLALEAGEAIQIDVSQWSQGVYYLQVNTGKEVIWKKFIINRNNPRR